MSKARLVYLLVVLLLLSACEFSLSGPGEISCTVPALVSAIDRANDNQDLTVIQLPVSCEFVLTDENNSSTSSVGGGANGLPIIRSPITLRGTAARSTIRRADSAGTAEFRIFYVDGASGGELNLEYVVLMNGRANNGGGIFNDEGIVRLMEGAEISGNSAARSGGGIFSWNGIVEKPSGENAFILNNVARDFGGGIYAIRNSSLSGDEGRNILLLDGVVFQGNRLSASSGRGGGIYTNADQMTLTNISFYGNEVAGEGGAIYVAGEGSSAIISRSEFVSNSARYGGGVSNGRGDAGLEISDSWFYRNSATLDGGAIYNGEEMHVSGSLFEENEAVNSGGAIKNWPSGVLHVINSTFSSNSAPEGSAIFNFGRAFVSYSTIVDSAGEGALLSWYATIEIANMIVANNQGGDCAFIHDPSLIEFSGVNLDSDGTCLGFDLSADPILGPLQDNGGRTHTYALLAGSPALNIAAGSCPESDQRTELRPVGSACDLGAYESSISVAINPADLEPSSPIDLNTLIVERDFPCYTGPGPKYNTLSTLKAGTQMQVVGYSFGGGWLVALHPTLADNHCWIDENFVIVNIPLDQLRLISVPPKPTATPTPKGEEREPSLTACPTSANIPGTCQ